MLEPDRHILIYGPAYLDFVVRVHSPLTDSPDPPIDGGCDGRFVTGGDRTDRIVLVCPNGAKLTLTGLDPDRYPTGLLMTLHDVLPAGYDRQFVASDTIEDLGGMGAGFATALGGRLVSALPNEPDGASEKIVNAIERAAIDFAPIIVDNATTDFTIVITSGPDGDKLPIGIRGCHAAMRAVVAHQPGDWSVVITASLHNELIVDLLAHHPTSLRVLAPTSRNCRDRSMPLGRLAEMTDLLALNAREWAILSDADRRAWRSSGAIISITDGPAGADIYWRDRTAEGERLRHHEPAFPRSNPPVDTNRAGEAFAAFLVLGLLRQGWTVDSRAISEEIVRYAARMAAVAAGLVIGRPAFGFPTSDEIAHVLDTGKI